MRAIVLVRKGNSEGAFEIRDVQRPEPVQNEVLIKVEASGLNFADVMARRGLYDDAPAIPFVPGYDVVGKIVKKGVGVTDLREGDRVVALTRFGGYAEFAVTDARAVVVIPESIDAGEATALATQYSTAFYCCYHATHLHAGDRVLIHAAAGGVGTALVQMAKNSGCIVYATASEEKLKHLERMGVDYPINYRKDDFTKVIRSVSGERSLDVIFDSIGGASVRKGYSLLNYGGRMVCLGASELISARGNIIKLLGLIRGFGIYSPVNMFRTSKSLICVNMLHIADHKPELLQRCLKGVYELYLSGKIKPHIAGVFGVNEIARAHSFLESRKSVGKIVIQW